MRIWPILVVSGAIITIMGTIFYFQGQSVVGPESSFMYSNPDWISYGLQILILGVAVLAVGIAIKILKKA